MKHLIQAVWTVRGFLKKMKRDRVDAYAAQSAFYVIMGFIPCVMLVLTMLQYTPLTEEDAMKLLIGVMPDSFSGFLKDIVESVYTQSTVLISGTVIGALWAAGRAILAITNGLNSIYEVEETRNYVFMRLRSGFYMLLMLLSLVLAMGLLVFGNEMHDLILQNIPFLRSFSGFIISVRTMATLVILTLLFTAMYVLLPNKKKRFLTQLPGAAAAAVSWSAFSYGFSVYFSFAKKMSTIYGSLTTVVMIMLWLYFCMWLLFAGAQINYYLEEPISFT